MEALHLEVYEQLHLLIKKGNLYENRRYIQHGSVSVLRHCIAVAICSCKIADTFHLQVDRKALIRGALLHDYFLYDWHIPDKEHELHGFTHPFTARDNAKRDYMLSPREENIIVRHMFPLVPIPPTCTEAWIVCLADKICASQETAHGFSNRAYDFSQDTLKDVSDKIYDFSQDTIRSFSGKFYHFSKTTVKQFSDKVFRFFE